MEASRNDARNTCREPAQKSDIQRRGSPNLRASAGHSDASGCDDTTVRTAESAMQFASEFEAPGPIRRPFGSPRKKI